MEAKKYIFDIHSTNFLYPKRLELPIFDGEFKIVLDAWFYFPDNRRRDTHNSLKILLDGLEGVIYADDRYVLPRIQDWTIDRQNPRVELKIYPKEKE